MRRAWATSTRSSRLPSDWPKRRAQTKRRAAGMCEARPHEPGCDGVGAECDHVIPNDDHSLANLQWLSAVCHRAKTLREAQTARGIIGRSRPSEQHPGKITT